MIHTLDELTPEARAAAQRYLDAVGPTIDEEYRDLVLGDLSAYLRDHLDTDATERDVQLLAEQAGPVVAGSADAAPYARLRNLLREGIRLTGIDARIASTWWSPADERLFLPRVLGLGWDLNFGALAVRLGLIEPDAEAVPFTSTPDAAFRAAAGLPIALAAATALHYLVRGRALPAMLPDHWDIAGSPDRWTQKGRAAAADLAATIIPAAVAGWAALSQRPRPNRAGTIAGATAFASIGATVTAWRSLGDRPRPWAGPAMIGVLTTSVGVVLYGLAKAGRDAEIRRDLKA